MFASLDITLLEWIQNHRIESLDGVLSLFSTATTYISFGIILAIGIFSRFSRNGVTRMVQIGLVLFLAGLITFAVKNTVKRTRPFKAHESIEKLTLGGGTSFPSGHTTEAFAVAATVALLYRRRSVQIPAILWAILVAYSRMALGVHYPGDVLGGLVFGVILAYGVNDGFRRWVNPP
ncbi:MAG: phosphatase PAP2 family protein [Bacteroidales bacterium]|nr:phosphatase PAP2 family protein [Bacteroidales bacterium]